MTLASYVMLMSTALPFVGINSLIVYVLPRLLRKDSGLEKRPKKLMLRVISLLLVELFLVTASFFACSYVISYNNSLAIEGDADAIKAYWEDMISDEVTYYNNTHLNILLTQENCVSYFPGFSLYYSVPLTHMALYSTDWEELANYRNRGYSIDENAPFWLEPEEMLERAQAAGESQLQTKTLHMPSYTAKIFMLLMSTSTELPYDEYYRVQTLPLQEQWERFFTPQLHEYCMRMVMVPYNDGKNDGYLPLAFGEEQIAQLDTPYEEEDIYYLFVRCEFTQSRLALSAYAFYYVLRGITFDLIFALILSFFIQNIVLSRKRIRRQREKAELLLSIAHELKTPMGTASLYAEKIGRSRSIEQAHENTAMLQREVLLMRDRLGTLLLLSKMDEAAVLNKSALSLGDLLEDVSDEYVPQMDDKGILFDITAPPGFQVIADRARLRIALSNLLSNAVKFTPEGGEIRLTLEPKGRKYARVSVYNNGPQIPKEDQKRIWNYLYKSDHSGLPQQGSGLGLPIVRRIAALHGGGCGGENTKTGVVFWFELTIKPRRTRSKKRSSER